MATELGSRLRSAREGAGLTQQQVADWMGLRRPAIAEIEAGTRSVKSEELVRLAALFGRSVAWFVSGQLQPEDRIAAALFRTASQTDPVLRSEAARLARRCALVMDVEEALDLQGHHRLPVQYANPGALLDWSTAHEHGREVAYQERARLGIGLNAPLRDPWGIVEDAGLHVFNMDLGRDSAVDGIFTRTDQGRVCVGVNADKWVFRQVFTVVHEYGHAILDGDVGADTCDTSQGWRRTTTRQYANRELRANQFAAVFLVPKEALLAFLEARGRLDRRKRVPSNALTPFEIVRAQDHFGVSGDMLLWRMQNEGLIESATRKRLRAELDELGTIAVARALGYDWRRFAQPFSRAHEVAIRAYVLGHTTLGQLAEIFAKPKEEMLSLIRQWGVEQELSEDDLLIGNPA